MLQGLIPVMSASQLEQMQQEERAAAEAKNSNPGVQSIAAHAKRRWELVRDTRSEAEERLASCLRQRNGEYDPKVLAAIREQGGSEIFMQLTSVKCRGASSWLRDTLLGSGVDKPWTLDTTPIPDLPPSEMEALKAQVFAEAEQYFAMMGVMPSYEDVRQRTARGKDEIMSRLQMEGKRRVERMELKMEDQLVEGNFRDQFSEFIDDIVTFPTAIMKGPVPRKRKKLKWNGDLLEPVEEIMLEWERVDPFKFYPAPWASSINDGFVIERHRLTREDIEAMQGVDGYNSEALNAVLAEFDSGGLREWLSVDSVQVEAEGKNTSAARNSDLIDAIQLWDVVTGKMLKEWGLDDTVEDTKSYPAEIWLVGNWVVKAVLNYDPLGRKPYFCASYEKVPGSFWGNGVADLVRDCQQMCNAAARALSNNMGIASGPQVAVNVSRLPPGEPISRLHPWKLWQFQNSDFQDASKPLEFFQPPSNAQELMAVFEKYSQLADEFSGIPRYMTGEHAPGAGRTASGLSMLINNASKGLKQVINNIDTFVLQPLLERLYQHNLRYSQDPDLIGDVTIQAKGAMSLVAKESAAVRRNEFLQLVLSSPQAGQIVGIPGTAELLRDMAKQLDMPVDKIVPTREQIQDRMAAEARQQELMMQAAMNPEFEDVQFQRDDQGAITGATKRKPKQLLPDGSPAGGRPANLMANSASGATG